MVYYVEYIFAENFLIDFILLFITGKLLKKTIIYRRLIISSVLGAVYVILTAYIGREFMTYFIVKFSVSVLMVMIAYDSKGIAANLRTIIVFYITSLLMVGIITALYYLDYDKLTVNAIVCSIFMGYAALHFFFKEIKAKFEKHNYMRNVEITVNNKSKILRAYIDTGNELTEPMSGKPVIVANMECIKNLLSKELYEEILICCKNGKNSYENLLNMKSDVNLRIVKYNTISSIGENMICLVPDNIEITDDKNNIVKTDAVIGIYPGRINKKDDYDALLFKKLLELERETNNEYVKSC
ncbi:sigma-E processing peptidase SpoIIGA [Sedimentibacter saalensis]|uniref:Sporulation sigma-E factor-processing peptidase n=1 Tax=Sedimentibacter saalensis TaxID=130788 RepID=A0A562J315_9FIRM|nr:sigma-E processing peptidase SpoIIGA [Sedimentibacter saalensis]TWH77659.1 sigma-E processing peptidase SpoIIGA [Sedimentibacter saalensis]